MNFFVPETCESCNAPQTLLMRSGDLRDHVGPELQLVLTALLTRHGSELLALFCPLCGDFAVMLPDAQTKRKAA